MLVLYGAHADETGSTADFAELADRLACPAVVVPDAEHSPAVEDPGTMIAALDAFWRDVSEPR
jgi:pimeloyl-ACP methyl ester carboxylesterase